MRKPNFFVVGAPKCGTTALTQFLGQHPEVYFPSRKELHYFGSDLTKSRIYPETLEDYLAYYAKASEQHLATGDASVMYLYSRAAAAEIRDFNEDARIIIMLRHPVDVMYAHHSQLLYGGFETERDFGAALALEAERQEGKRIPKGAYLREALFYRSTVRFAEQIERYLSVFGADRVKIIFFEDFAADNAGVFRDVCAFLGVSSTFEPHLRRINENKRVRSAFLHGLLDRRGTRRTIGKRIPDALHWRLERLNTQYVKRQPMPQDLHSDLTRELRGEVERLQKVTGKNLGEWL